MSSISSNSVAAPVQAAPIPTCIQRLIEKRVSQVACSRFEQFSHWFLTRFSCACPAYEDSLRNATTLASIAKTRSEMQTTHLFFDCTPLFDRTEGRIVTISSKNHSIFLRGREVLFSTVGKSQIALDGEQKIELIIHGIRDECGDHYGFFRIILRKDLLDRDEEQYWIVDTNKQFLRFCQGSEEGEIVYVVEEEIKQGIDTNYVQPID